MSGRAPPLPYSCQLQCLVNRNWTTRQPLLKGFAFDQFEDEKKMPVGFLEVVDCSNVGMIQRGEKLSFTLKAADAVRVARELVGEDLTGDVTFQFCVVCSIDFTHPSGAHERHKLVVANLPADP